MNLLGKKIFIAYMNDFIKLKAKGVSVVKKIAVFCIIAVLVAGYFYSKIDNSHIKYSTNENFSAKTGWYEIGQSATLKIYEITESGEVYFDVLWVGLNGFGGVAESNSKEKASFKITYQGNGNVVGSLTLQKNNIILEVQTCSLEYIEKGTYTFEYSNPIDKNYTELGSRLRSYIGQGASVHKLFEQFTIDYFPKLPKEWTYLGYTNYLFEHILFNEEYNEVCDFYKVKTFDNETKYYVLCDIGTGDNIKVATYEIDSGDILNKVWEKKLATPEKREEYEENPNKTFGNERTSNIDANKWYTLKSDNSIHCQNAEIYRAVPTNNGNVYLVTYYPVCADCHICADMQMVGVSTNAPVAETNYCNRCKKSIYSKFKLEY